MKTLLTLVALLCIGTPQVTLAKDPKKSLEQFKSIVTQACKAKGLKVSFRTTHAFGVTTMIPHVHGKLDDDRDSAWEVFQASYPALADWASRSGGMGHGTAQTNQQNQEAPAKGTDYLHSFRINADDFASLAYQNKTGKGSLVMCFIDGSQYIDLLPKIISEKIENKPVLFPPVRDNGESAVHYSSRTRKTAPWKNELVWKNWTGC